MRDVGLILFAVTLSLAPNAFAKDPPNPGCAHESAVKCLQLAVDAMGGRERLEQLKNVRLQNIGHTLLMEQSYRQAPFITSYFRDVTTLDLTNQRMAATTHSVWPESDPNQAESDTTLIVGPDGGVYHAKESDSPCSLSDLAAARQMLSLGPARVLLTASSAPDLHFEPAQTLRSTPHTVVAFTWQKVPVRVLINSFNHLPDAVETTQVFHDFWYFWGDVQQRIYFDNWKLSAGITYPSNLVEERNGVVWSSTQALNIEFNVPIDDKSFAMDAKVAKQSTESPGWNRPFRAGKDTVLAPGVDLFLGSWNSTIVKQSDGIVILEAPISGLYTEGVVKEAKKRYPELPIKAVLSTSDSWPHTGGVRYAVAQHFPIYILDLNRPLLERMVAAPHTLAPNTLAPDVLTSAKQSTAPDWKIVSDKEIIGIGDNRMELYPLRGASTERQYMVYFPAHRLLYASDTLAMNDDGTLYDPELMYEVVQAAKRANLQVDTVFAMHQAPMSWSQVVALVEKAQHS
jgi:glyoxylase-like metal-dependent hydrolase (beta-lactamase superfamily II)